MSPPPYDHNEYNGSPNKKFPGEGTCNPIHLGSGNKYHEELLYRGGGEFPLEFKLYYNSRSHRKVDSYDVIYGQWTFSYGQHLLINTDGTIEMVREDGQSRFFRLSGPVYAGIDAMDMGKSSWLNMGDMLGLLEALPEGGYSYISLDGVKETYNSYGFLTQVKNLHGGGTHNITYGSLYPDNTAGTTVTVTYAERNESISFFTELL